jgi:putative intracellular protease/amidase
MPDTVHLYVFDGYADWEPAFAVAGIGNPQFQREPGRWRVRTVAEHPRRTLRSMGGLAVRPDQALAALRPADSRLLILPGGPGWDDPAMHGAAVDLATRFLDGGVPVAAICGATAGLARAGLLDERPHTSNALAYLKGTGYAGEDAYVDEPAVSDGLLITAGGMAPLEFAREIFATLGIYEEEALASWYQLYKSGKSAHYARMARAAEGAAEDAEEATADPPDEPADPARRPAPAAGGEPASAGRPPARAERTE